MSYFHFSDAYALLEYSYAYEYDLQVRVHDGDERAIHEFREIRAHKRATFYMTAVCLNSDWDILGDIVEEAYEYSFDESLIDGNLYDEGYDIDEDILSFEEDYWDWYDE